MLSEIYFDVAISNGKKRNGNMHISEDPTTVIKVWEDKDKKP